MILELTRINQELAIYGAGKITQTQQHLFFSHPPPSLPCHLLNKGNIIRLFSYMNKNPKSLPWLFSFPHSPYLSYHHILHWALSKCILNLTPHSNHYFTIILIIFYPNNYDSASVLIIFFLIDFIFWSFWFAEKLRWWYRVLYTPLSSFPYY